MIEGFSTLPATPSVITITPVSNGWVVRMPADNSKQKNPIEQMKDMASALKDVLHGDKNDLDEIMRQANISGPDQNRGNRMIRDQAVYIFQTFKDVIDFLSYEMGIGEEDPE